MSSPEIGASTVRDRCTTCRSSARGARSTSPTRTSCRTRRPSTRSIEAKRRGVDVRIMVSGVAQRQLAGAAEQRAAVRPRCSRRASRSSSTTAPMLHHKTMVVDARLGDDRDDQLRQPIVRAQRREQRLLLQPRAGRHAARHVHRRSGGLRSRRPHALAVAAVPWRGSGIRRVAVPGTDLGIRT